jgi:hypothetical protein
LVKVAFNQGKKNVSGKNTGQSQQTTTHL